jgi:hypothetical protein
MLRRIVTLGEPAARLEDHVDPELFPRQLSRILGRQDAEFVAVY